MSYTVVFRPAARRDLADLPQQAQAAVVGAAAALAERPRPVGAKALQGNWRGYYRVVVASVYRVVYSVEDRALVVCVVRIKHRRDVYRSAPPR